MNEVQVFEKLHNLGQTHILKNYAHLTPHEQALLLDQIKDLDIEMLNKQKMVLNDTVHPSKETYAAYTDYTFYKDSKDISLGKQLLSQGKVGCLVVAGGEGSRLGFQYPKGMFPISIVKEKSLFQLLAEKIKAAQVLFQSFIPLSIMTSPKTHEMIVSFFEKNSYFGLSEDVVSFFCQHQACVLDEDGDLVLQDNHLLEYAPNGNGYTLHHFSQSPIYEQWLSRGIEILSFLPIDNPLADPIDPNFIGYHHRFNYEVSLKSIFRQEAKESLGVIVKDAEGLPQVVEYSEISEEDARSIIKEGFKYPCAHIALFMFNLSFIDQFRSCYDKEIPLHKHTRKIKIFDRYQENCYKTIYKFEYFIFDVLKYSNSTGVIVYPREKCFSPLKSKEGRNGVESVKKNLLHKDRELYYQLTGRKVQHHIVFELDPQFHYPSKHLKCLWKNRYLPENTSYLQSN